MLTFLYGLIRGHLVLKIMALLFAVILWSFVLADTNPARERDFRDISVSYVNASELAAKGLDISESLSEQFSKVDIRIEARQSDLKYINMDNISAFIDLSEINSTGEYKARVRAETRYGRVVSVSPANVTLFIDDHVTQQVPVNLQLDGSVPEGYHADPPAITPGVINISGARVDVEKVASAVCVVDLDGLTEGYNKSVEVELLDSEGNTVDKTLFKEATPSVIVQLDILHKKTVPIDVENSIFGQNDIAAGYEIVNITCTPREVQIVGEAAALADVTSISLVPYPISGANLSLVTLLDYLPPQGVRVLTHGKAEVFVNIREKTDTLEFERVEVLMKNLESGRTARLSTRLIDVTVIAGLSRISEITLADVMPYVDLENLGAGTYTLDIRFELPVGLTAENFSPSVSTVTVTIS